MPNRATPRAQNELGKLYLDGRGVSKDYAEALRWFDKSADQNDTHAESALGYMYFAGEGVPQNDAQSVAWYRKAAEQGFAPAQQALGWMYFNSRGVSKDYAEAVAWYEKAADQGDAVAQASLGYMYAYGVGVERDGIAAFRWYKMAAAQGDPGAIRFIKSIRPPARTQHFELRMGIVDSIVGLVFLLPLFESFFRRKIHRGWLTAGFAALGLFLSALAALDFYASAHDIRYSPYHTSFHTTKKALTAIGVILICTVVLPAKKKPEPSAAGAEHS